jgi:hypothetical protein
MVYAVNKLIPQFDGFRNNLVYIFLIQRWGMLKKSDTFVNYLVAKIVYIPFCTPAVCHKNVIKSYTIYNFVMIKQIFLNKNR